LRESELRFRTVYERSPVGIALVESSSGRFLQVNPKFCEIAGREEEELLRTDVASITHPDDIVQGGEYRHELAEARLASYEMDKRYIRPDGSVRWVRILVVPMSGKAETRRWQMGLVEDITERRQSEEAITTLVQELCEAKKKLTEEKLYLEQEINTELGYGEIIGQSKALQAVMENVGKVASSDATVLLLGETGTGKELVARAIHRLSRRANNGFIKMNCAAIPWGLLESELFGHERGAFTGAVSKKIGRLELADKGTLFLDEIGEISLALQPKLLRVLQDQEFERLGGTQTLKVDFRLIAATNSNLADRVRESEFRSDLYYRLNVFPIRVPPLRERREDIRLLVEHFVQKFARRMNKSITSIPKKTMDALTGWEWPGNVRELENFVERSVILTQGSVLVSPLSELQPMGTTAEENGVDESLEATEREHILRALRESHGQIGGLRGAAMRLGLKRTTLQSKLKHLRINPRSGSPGH
jgi:formate hydrogenlyase transcriptional activator